MLEMKKFALVFADPEGEDTFLVEDEALIAHIHDERYAQLFAAAPEMLAAVSEFAAGPCETDTQGNHAAKCRTCVASNLINKLAIAGGMIFH